MQDEQSNAGRRPSEPLPHAIHPERGRNACSLTEEDFGRHRRGEDLRPAVPAELSAFRCSLWKESQANYLEHECSISTPGRANLLNQDASAVTGRRFVQVITALFSPLHQKAVALLPPVGSPSASASDSPSSSLTSLARNPRLSPRSAWRNDLPELDILERVDRGSDHVRTCPACLLLQQVPQT